MQRISNLENLHGERFLALDKALVLKASETDVHLKALNGEAERLRTMQVTYLPREVYESNYKAIIMQIDELRQFRSTTTGRQSVHTVVISTIIAALIAYLARITTFIP